MLYLNLIRRVLVRQVISFAVVLFLLVLVQTAMAGNESQEIYEKWSKIGNVSHWMDLDTQFFRTLDNNAYLDRSQFKLDQIKAYEESLAWDASLPGPVGLDQFRSLDAAEQAERRELALDELGFVTRFRRVQDQLLQEARENIPNRNTNRVQDRSNLTDCLRVLNLATGLDPENFYAWHLQGYFAACVGDNDRARISLLAAARAMNSLETDQFTDMKQRIMLDLAWLERDLGLFAKASQRLAIVKRLAGEQQSGKISVEIHLLEGLIAAQTGNQEKALKIASDLRSQPVRLFPTDYTKATMTPQVTDIYNWQKVNSNYMQSWIIALIEIKKGDLGSVGKIFGEFSINRFYPYASRFWNDAGMIYERTNRFKSANNAWAMAKISRPWLLHMIYKPYGLKLGELTGNPGPVEFCLGFDSFYICGSRLAYGAMRVGEVAIPEDMAGKQAAASRALDQLEICQRSGEYSGQASVLQGQVFFLMNDHGGATAELKEAVAVFKKEGDEVRLASAQQDLDIIAQKMNLAGSTQYASQSGQSKGRWDADTDPESKEAALVAILEKDPGNEVAKLELARHYIRHDKAEEGRQMAFALYDPSNIDQQTIEVVILVLEADRVLGKDEMATVMVRQLEKGRADQWDNAGLWSLVGSICQNHGNDVDARKAMEFALELDPENQGIRNQLYKMN